MTYQELQNLFRQRLNRRDITQALVEHFITHSIQRIQRLLRTPGSEKVLIYPFGDTDSVIDLPGDYLKLVSICVDGGDELVRASLTDALRASRVVGTPCVFARSNSQFVLGPRPSPGTLVQLVYHANYASLSSPTDTNALTDFAPDVIIDGALSKACEHFVDPRRESFENSFVTALVDLNTQAADDELVNAQVSTGYNLNFWPED